MVIHSSHNALYKYFKSLHRKKYRQREAALLLEGERLISQAAAVLPIEYLIVSEALPDSPAIAAKQTVYLSRLLFESLADTVNSQGVLAVVKMSALENPLSFNDHIIVCDRIQDPGNLGTIMRSAEAFGYRDVILLKGTVDPYSSKVIRASMSAMLSLNIRSSVSEDELLAILRENGYPLVVTAMQGDLSLADFEGDRPVAVVFGNEANGVSASLMAKSDHRLFIPIRGDAESLNVAISAGIAMYGLRL